jgi:hypothetical protein
LFGGTDESSDLNDFWVFDVTKNVWTPIEVPNGPSPRFGSKMIFDSIGNQLFIFGRKSLRGSESLKVSTNGKLIQIPCVMRLVALLCFFPPLLLF